MSRFKGPELTYRLEFSSCYTRLLQLALEILSLQPNPDPLTKSLRILPAHKVLTVPTRELTPTMARVRRSSPFGVCKILARRD